jgi:hypothetical protein
MKPLPLHCCLEPTQTCRAGCAVTDGSGAGIAGGGWGDFCRSGAGDGLGVGCRLPPDDGAGPGELGKVGLAADGLGATAKAGFVVEAPAFTLSQSLTRTPRRVLRHTCYTIKAHGCLDGSLDACRRNTAATRRWCPM